MPYRILASAKVIAEAPASLLFEFLRSRNSADRSTYTGSWSHAHASARQGHNYKS